MTPLDEARALLKELETLYANDAGDRAIAILRRIVGEGCPGHVASDSDPKVCGRCDIHIDELRPI